MLRVTLDVNGRVIGRMDIVNRGPSEERSQLEDDWRDYSVQVVTSTGKVLGDFFPVKHRRSEGAWALVDKCTEAWRRGSL